MKWRQAVLLPLIFVLWACAEGGTRGSGIFSTEVQGNVASVQIAALMPRPAEAPGFWARLRAVAGGGIEPAAHAATDLEGIRVVIEGTSIQATTDADGNFTLAGAFDGMVTLLFELPQGGTARIGLNVPAAGTMTMSNVDVDTQTGVATAEQLEVDFEGEVVGVYCQALVMRLVSSHAPSNDMDTYDVDLATSSVTDSRGDAVPCPAIPDGAVAEVRGVVNPDGSFGDATVQLQQ